MAARHAGLGPWRLLRRLAWQVGISAAFALLAARAVDLERLRDALVGVQVLWLLPALFLFTAAKFVDAWRWRYLLRGVTAAAGRAPPQRVLFGAFLVGNAVNNLLPLRAGDAAKVQLLANRYGASRAGVASSLFLVEATLDGAMFILLLIASVGLSGGGGLPAVTAREVIGLALIASVALGVVVAIAATGQRLSVALRLLPQRWRVPLTAQFARAAEGLHAFRSWRRAAVAMALSAPAWLLEAGMFALMGRAFGLDHGYGTYLAAMVAANLAVAVPIALWNVGPYEALVAAVAVAAGTDQPMALAYAFGVHMLTSAWILATGLVAFLALRVSPRELLGVQTPR